MMEDFISALSPGFVLLSFAVPFYLGYRRARRGAGILAGWGLFVVALLFQDLIAPALAYEFVGREAGRRLAPDQPGTLAAIGVGWAVGGLFYVAGRGVRALKERWWRSPEA